MIFDVDATYRGSDEWYEEVAKSRPPKDQPWYHILVDGETHTTYVAERNLEPDTAGDEIDHPLVDKLFDGLKDGRYRPISGVN